MLLLGQCDWPSSAMRGSGSKDRAQSEFRIGTDCT